MIYIVFIFGVIIGSFLNVCIYRVPHGESFVFSRSRCPQCGHELKWWELIPVISFLVLKGKCSQCNSSIDWQYTFVEIFTGLIFLILYLRFGFTINFYIYLLLFSILIILSGIDIRFRIIPDIVTIPALVVGFIVSIVFSHITYLNSILGIIAGGGSLLLIAYLSRGGMGGGDIKMMAMVGAFAGWKVALMSIFLGAFIGSINGLILIIIHDKKSVKSSLPFGPYLSFGVLISILYYQRIIEYYLDLFL